MDTNNRNGRSLTGVKSKDGPPGPVAFPGIGTRLRRSRSKDHSNEFDNLSTEIANLKHYRNTTNAPDIHLLPQGGTLERPKRLYNTSTLANYANSSDISHSSFIYSQQSLYGSSRCAKNGSFSALYDESRLLAHQYEEPHLLLDHLPVKDSQLYRTESRQKEPYLNGGKHSSHHLYRGRASSQANDQADGTLGHQSQFAHNSYVVLDKGSQLRPNTTVIPPSKLFAKTLSSSCHKPQLYEEPSSKSSSSSKQSTNVPNRPSLDSANGDGDGESKPVDTSGQALSSSTCSLTDQSQSPLPTATQQQYLHQPAMSVRLGQSTIDSINESRIHNDLTLPRDLDPSADTQTKLCLTSSSQSSVMHTYANPFQHCGSSVSEDTTGPIIPDMNSLRPSQMLKNSFSGSDPPPNLQSRHRRTFLSYLSNRLWSQVRADHKTSDLGEHRCSWRVSTLTLTVLVFVMLIIIIFLSAMNRANFSAEHKPTDNSKVPCIVVEDLDSTSSHLASSGPYGRQDMFSSDVPTDNSFSPQACPMSLPRDPLQFKELRLTEANLSPFSLRLQPYTAWTVWFSQNDPFVMNFQFYAPIHSRLALFAHKNEPPSLTAHQVFQVISEDSLSQNQNLNRIRRDSQLIQLQFENYFDQGSWYLTVQNDMDQTVPLVVNISLWHNTSKHCPNNCHNHGHCHLGKCQCFPGFIGFDCADNVCPVFCGGNGQYLQGSCRCELGWKGRECTVRSDECEVSDCSGNGLCVEGSCQCHTGFKGEHCELVDCLDPACSGHGVCVDGACFCKAGWTGTNCSSADTKLHHFFPNCSNNGVFDFESNQCMCYSHYSGEDCSKFSCSLDCGLHGSCSDGRCQCQDGWFGSNCQHRQCDSRCLEHGKCLNGTCSCQDGWMGKYCTLDGCPNQCSSHGKCISSKIHQDTLVHQSVQWSCQCDEGWGGPDCSASQETNCDDEVDNDNDGLVDCADSECCRHEQCNHGSLMCITSPDPLDILLRKQPPSPTSSFFQKVHFLIEEGSVQSYAQKDAYSQKRAAVIRGQVVSQEQNALIGIRVSVATDPQFGFTLTRSDGWFDILVNGGGIVTLQFQRNPFYPIRKSVFVAWNDITVIQNPIVMHSVPENGNEFHTTLTNRAFPLFYNLFSRSDFGEIQWIKWLSKSSNVSWSKNCAEHDYEQMKPMVRDSLSSDVWFTQNTGVVCGNQSCILAENQMVHEKIPIGTSQLYLVYQSSQAQGYHSTIFLHLTPSVVPKTLRFVLLRILVEGNIHEKIFEADPSIKYTFSWNKRNVYKQKVYGFTYAKVYVGYIYVGCPSVIWNAFSAKLRGYDMEISELGSWNLDIHHRYNLFDGLFQRGDGQLIYFRDNSGQLPLVMKPIGGSHLEPRPFTCGNSRMSGCGTDLSTVRFFSLVSLTSAPDGSVFVGDSNLIRRITPDGRIRTVYRFKSHPNRQTFEYYIAFNSLDSHLYISDPERFQILKVPISDNGEHGDESNIPEIEVVVGTGERCFPHDKALCGDGKSGLEVQLMYPKGLAFGLDGSLFFADGNVIRVLDTNGYVQRVVGQWNRRQWKPSSCKISQPANEIKLTWPTSLAVNPIDGTLYFVDNYVLLKLSQEMHVSIVAGYPSFCLDDAHFQAKPNISELSCKSDKLDAKMFAYCGEDLLFGSFAFTPNGDLFIADISHQSENRIFTLISDGFLRHVAGFKSHDRIQNRSCSVERCTDISGRNCTCLILDSTTSSASYSDKLDNNLMNEYTIGVKTKLTTVTALAAAGDGTIYVADEGSLRLYTLQPYMPQLDDLMEVKVLSPNLAEMYVFNEHGQHTSTRSIVTGQTLYTFHYNQANSFGKLLDVTDTAGNKVSFMRDSSGALHTIETSSGLKCRTTVNKLGFLEQFSTNSNNSLYFEYFPNGLVRSKLQSDTGRTYFYEYDQDGRLANYLQPSGAFTTLDFKSDQSAETLLANEVYLFNGQEPNVTHFNQLEFSISSGSQIRWKRRDQTVNIQLLSDGSVLVNTSRHLNAYFGGTASKLSQAMLFVQAQMFPLVSHCRLENTQARDSSVFQSIDMVIDYGLKMKNSVIASVEKFVAVNNSLMLRLEYDWKANREIYYNQSQRPILFLQYDEYGRPIQWIPNVKDRWSAHSLTYDKFGQLASWQDGAQSQSFVRDMLGRLVEVRHNDQITRYAYDSASNDHNTLFQLPSSVGLRSGHKYFFELDNNGRVKAIITPKGSRHELNIKIVLGYYKYSYCPPIMNSDIMLDVTPSSHCFLLYFNEQFKPSLRVFPYDSGKVIYKYGNRVSLSKDLSKDLHRLNEGNLVVDQIIYGTGVVERWYDPTSAKDFKGIWRNGNVEFGNVMRYTRVTGLLKHQSYLFSHIHSVSQLVYSYRYDSQLRLRAIQAKLGSITLPTQEFTYAASGQVESTGDFRYFERNQNETLIGDGVALFVRRFDSIRDQLRYASLAIADKELVRVDYVHDANGKLTQTRTFMRHLGANKMRLQNFTYDQNGQLLEVQGREHWRFMYDFNGNLNTFLYLGNRIDIEYDSADRIKSFGKGQHSSAPSGSSPYVTDSRGFVVHRGDEHLEYNNLGQLMSVRRPNRYEVSYIYDYKGRLVVRRDHHNNVTQYFYGNPRKPNLVTHAFNNADGSVLSLRYDDHDDSLLMLRLNNENYYVMCDQNKSPLLVFDHRGQVVRELHRSPFGHVLFDSNPAFYVPFDFQGGIPDPLTNLIHFAHGRVYDTLTGHWLTPDIDSLLTTNLLINPRAVHSYHFSRNDPINLGTTSDNGIVSLSQVQQLLKSQSSSMAYQDINMAQLRHLAQFELGQFPSTINSMFLLSLKFTLAQLKHFYGFKSNYFSKLSQEDWTAKQGMLGIISTQNVMFGPGILFTQNQANSDLLHAYQSVHVNPLLRQLVTEFINGSHLLDVHLVMASHDYYFLVHVRTLDPQSLAKLQHYRSVANFTVQEVYSGQSDADKKLIIEVRVYLDTVTLNIRFGSSIGAERDRVLKVAQKHAWRQRLLQERANIQHSKQHAGWTELSDDRKQFVLATTDNFENNSNWLSLSGKGSVRMGHYHSVANCEQLAEDASNVQFESKHGKDH